MSATLRRVLPGADETRITGGAFRPTGSTCNVLNLCSAISCPPRSGVRKKIIVYCFIVIVNNSSSERDTRRPLTGEGHTKIHPPTHTLQESSNLSS